MNKLSTFFNFTENKRLPDSEITDKKLLEESAKSMEITEKPSRKVVEFLLAYSQSLESKNGYSYQLN